MDDESQRLVDWLDKGVCDALQRKYLRIILFIIFEEDGALIEEYSLSFSYGEKIGMALWLSGCTESMWTMTCNAADIWSSACTLVRNLVSLMCTCDKIPRERIIMMKLLYYDDVTPPNYEPPFFRCCDDIRKVTYQPQQTVPQDVIRDVESLFTYDVESAVPRNGRLVNKDFPSDSDSEIEKGYFYCITKKKATFYFDSAASRHMSGDKTLIQNLQRVSKQNWVTISTADSKSIRLDMAGDIKCGHITLSPVYLMEGLQYNIISVGQLDDGKNLIYLGENKINIIDTKTGVVIGEGVLHHKSNRYLAKNITSTHKLTPGRKKMRALAANDAESEPSEKVLLLKEPPLEAEKKLIWTLDCFCEDHMTCNKDLLCNIRPMKKTFLTPTGEVEATEVGDVRTDNVVLFNVLYCQAISANLISEGQLDRDGYSCTRLKHTCKIQYRKTKEICGQADEDKEYMYRVSQFLPVDHLNSKHRREDEYVEPSLKRQQPDAHSSGCSTPIPQPQGCNPSAP